MLQAFLKDDSGATVIEYGLIAGLVSIAILASLTVLGTTVDDGFTLVNDAMVSAAGDPSAEAPVAVIALEPILDGNAIAIQ